MGKNKVFGVCYCGMGTEYQDRIGNGLIKYARELGDVKLLFYTCFMNKTTDTTHDVGELSVFELINYKKLDGIILLAQTLQRHDEFEIADKIISRAKSFDVPCVAFDANTDKCSCVKYDTFQTIYDIVSHMIEKHGCKKINFICGYKSDITSIIRVNAYMKAMGDHGFAVDRKRISSGSWWTVPSEKAIDDWVKEGLEFDAVVCANDVMAISAMRSLEKNGLRVPQDVKVAGVDDLCEGRFHKPSLTSACFDFEKDVRIAIDILCGRKKEGKYTCSPIVKYRGSCGCDCDDTANLSDTNKYMHQLSFVQDDKSVVLQDLYRLQSTMVEQETVQKSFELLKSHVVKMWTWKMWVSINSDLFDTNITQDGTVSTGNVTESGYSKYQQTIAIKNEDDIDNDKIFDIKEICPNFDEEIEKMNFLMVFPLHVNDNIMGYIVKEHSNFYYMDIWYLFAASLSNALLSIKQQNELRFVNGKLEDMYIRDSMTNLYNRRGFFIKLRRYLMVAHNKNMQIASIDLDGLKHINDCYGHQEGDNAIGVISKVIIKLSENGKICARFGGDEFVVTGTDNSLDTFSEMVEEMLKEYNEKSVKPYMITASVGVISGECNSTADFDVLFKAADEKMYNNKSKKKYFRSRK